MSFYERNRVPEGVCRLDSIFHFILGILVAFIFFNAIPFFFSFGGKESTLSSIIISGSEEGKIEIDGKGGFYSNGLSTEYISLKNVDSKKVNLDGWVIKDRDGHSYVIKGIKLTPDRVIRLYSRSGDDHKVGWVDNYYLYWGSQEEIWDNDGDTVYLYNSHGKLIDSYTWTPSAPSTGRSSYSKTTDDYEKDWAGDRMAAHAYL